MKPVFIGEAPGRNQRSDCPLYPLPNGCAGHRLKTMCELGLSTYLTEIDRINLLPRCPDGAWPVDWAQASAENLSATVLAGRSVLVFGVRVRNAFVPTGWNLPMLAPVRLGRSRLNFFTFAWAPHPSGRNLAYNDETVRIGLRDYVAGMLTAAQSP